MPENTHFRFDFIASFSTLGEIEKAWEYMVYTYLLVPGNGSDIMLEQKLSNMANSPGWWQELGISEFSLQPLTEIHLYSDLFEEIQPNGSILYVYVFSGIALLILIIAVFNFVSLVTAQYTRRVNEIGIRKVHGASRKEMIGQFLAESFVIICFSSLIAVLIVHTALPLFGKWFDLGLQINLLLTWQGLLNITALILITTLLAGIYPAVVSSSFNPSEILKGNYSLKDHSFLKIGLVTGNFTITAVLLISSLTIYKQVNFLLNKSLGYEPAGVITLKTPEPIKGNEQSFMDKLEQQSIIHETSLASSTPDNPQIGQLFIEGDSTDIHYLLADHNYLETMGIKLVEGRNFDHSRPADIFRTVILNRAAVEFMGWQQPLNKSFRGLLGSARVIGVVENFNTLSLRRKIHPTVVQLAPPYFKELMIKTEPGSAQRAVQEIEMIWNEFAPGVPFEYYFLEDRLDGKYSKEQSLIRLVGLFTILAIFLSISGLTGIVSYTVNRKKREIGIRKVLGATVLNIAGLFTGIYLKTISLGLIIAVPVAWYGVNRWLQEFAYRVDIGAGLFIVSALCVVLIALTTAGLQSYKAALADPVKSLRDE